MVKFSSIKLPFEHAHKQGLVMNQADVKKDFFNGDLDEEISFRPLEGFLDGQYPNFACKLQGTLCGLNIGASILKSAMCGSRRLPIKFVV